MIALFFFTVNTGVSPSGKAVVFGTTMRRFESFHPNSLRLWLSEIALGCCLPVLRMRSWRSKWRNV
jgi:hypothetical protein